MKMTTRILGLLLLLPLAGQAQVKLSALTGEYSLGDASFGLALNGTTDDGAAANAALATIGAGKIVILPAGKTLLTCRQITVPAGTALIANGATIKRCNQPSATTTTNPITSGSTSSFATTSYASFRVGEQIAFSNGTQYSYLLTIQSCGTSTSGATCTASPLVTSTTAQTYTLTTGAAAASITGGTINIYRAFSTLATGGDEVSVRGLTFDGNAANTASLCRWEWCTEMKVLNSYFKLRDATFVNVPGEAIQESSYDYADSTTSITTNSTTTLTFTGGAESTFAVGDHVFAARDGSSQWDNGSRVVTAVDPGAHTVTVNYPFGGTLSGAGTTRLYKLLVSPLYDHNTFHNIAGNAVHFSASSHSTFADNTVTNGNTAAQAYDTSTGGTTGDGESNTDVGHSYGCVTYSSYVVDSVIKDSTLADCYIGIGMKGGSNDGVQITSNQILSAELRSISLYSPGGSTGGLHRVMVSGNRFVGDWSYIVGAVGALKGAVYVRAGASSMSSADYGTKNIQITGNEFFKTQLFASSAQGVLFANNTLDAWATNDNWGLTTIVDSNDIMVVGNLYQGGTKAIDIAGTSGTGSGVTVRGNTFDRQNAVGVLAQDADMIDLTIDGNTFIAPNGADTSATYYGIDGVPRGSTVMGNSFVVDKGAACIRSFNGTLDYTVAGNGSVVAGNVCRAPSGTLTDSITVVSGNTGLIAAGNYLFEAVNDSGTSTVTTPVNVIIP